MYVCYGAKDKVPTLTARYGLVQGSTKCPKVTNDLIRILTRGWSI